MPDRLIVTALPQRAAADPSGATALQLSAFISPRLEPTGTLATVASRFGGFDSLTTLLSSSVWTVQFEGLGTHAAAVTSTLDPTTWALLFPQTTAVQAFGYTSMSGKRLLSFPVKRLQSILLGLYEGLVLAPERFPKVRMTSINDAPDLSGVLGTLGEMNVVLKAIEDGVGPGASDDDIAEAFGVDATDTEMRDVVSAFYRVTRFYRRRIGSYDPEEIDPPPAMPSMEFHEAVALLADHPFLMRRLGLVVDLRVMISGIAPFQPGGRVRVQLTAAAGPIAGITISTPWTRYQLDATAGRFLAAPSAGSGLVGGMLDLSDPDRYEVVQLDVEGSALKTVQHAVALRNEAAQELAPNPLPTNEPIASLRTVGLGVAEVARTASLSARFAGQDTLNAAITSQQLETDDVSADEVLRGYRVDILDDSATWRSLHARDGSYLVGTGGRQQMLAHSDEGYVKSASVSSNAADSDDLYAHEMVFSWDGWSMSAKKPGRDLSVEKDADDPMIERATIENVPNEPHPNLDLVATYAVTPKTLPRLRFGRDYRVRARAVDLAGNSLTLAEVTTAQSRATGRATYRRFEPVSPPTLVHRDPVTEGEWIEHLVIRSDFDASTAEYVERDLVAGAGYPTTCQRHVAAPKATQSVCETHGMFDELMASDDPDSHRESYLLALRESGTFLDRERLDPMTAQYVELDPAPELHHTPTTPVRFHGQWPQKRGEALGPGQYVVHPAADILLPYLPDPMATGMVLWTPGNGGIHEQKQFIGDWPDKIPYRIVLREGSEVDDDVAFDVSGDVIEVRLPKAFIVKVRYGSTIDLDRVEHMHFWTVAQPSSDAISAVRAGTHWMFSPYRELSFVHAVQRPLEPPVADLEVDESRAPQQTFTTINQTIECHNRSSGQVDLYAHWDDWRDDLSHPAPRLVRRSSHITTAYPAYGGNGVTLKALHQLGDTQRHDVVYQAIATTRFREYFPASLWKDKRNIERPEQVFGEKDEDAPASAPLPLEKPPTIVLNTVRPDKPLVRYVMPTMRHTARSDGTVQTRTGRGVRVYLDRPWYSSGNGELLGVVLPHAQGSTPEDLVTVWASDPLRLNRAPGNPLEKGHFVNAADMAEGLTLLGTNRLVDVVGFEVEWDDEERRWFCDIQVETGAAYFPFLRFSFCRFQPESIEGAHLSAAVPTDFIQVLPDRVATIHRNANSFTVTLSGYTQDNAQGDQDIAVPEQPDLGNLALPGNQGAGVGLDLDILTPAPTRAAHHIVIARVEVRTDGDSDLHWRPANDGVELTPYEKSGEPGVIVWRGDVGPALASLETVRVVIEEYELYPIDEDVAGEPSIADKLPTASQRQGGYDKTGAAAGSRLVYVAHFVKP
jgi:hypothetical protein